MSLLGKKIGMSTLHTTKGAVPVTFIDVNSCIVTDIKTSEKNGYSAIQVGYGDTTKNNKPIQGHLKPSGASSVKLCEFRCDDPTQFEVGQELDATVFEVGDIVKVSGISKGRGFSGGVRRHGFAGGPKTHGQSDRWRAPGSIGAGSSPGRVWRGTKMAGQYGNKLATTIGLKVVEILNESNIVVIKGGIPGVKGEIVRLEKQS